jgi:dipeptidyl aminopeptidase/acylaminoacyl peptidase
MRNRVPSALPRPHALRLSLAVLCGALWVASGGQAARAAEPRPIALDDLFAIADVSDPDISPDGAWVAYTVQRVDKKRDRHDDDIYMTSWDGARTVRLTSSPDKEHTPRFSPDGRWLAFLSKRDDKHDADQLWLMNREGGEGERITGLKGGISDYVFSPDGARVVLAAEDPDPDEVDDEKKDREEGEEKKDDDDEKTAKPIVIDRYQFKEDEEGYLRSIRTHLYLLDLATRKVEVLTSGPYSELLPNWSPDGKTIVFVSKRGPDPDRTDNFDLYLVEARAGAEARRLTENDIDDNDPSWGTRPVFSPDGKSIAYLQGGPQKLIYYAGYHLAVISAAGGKPRLVLPSLDRNQTQPLWTDGGATLTFMLEDDGNVHLARVPAEGGKIDRILAGRRVVDDFAVGRDGRIAVLTATPDRFAEVFALDKGAARPLSRQNDALLAGLRLGPMEEISYKSADGAEIHGFVTKPAGFRAGTKYPTVLEIHGGPVGQFQNELEPYYAFAWQLLAANGYVVVAANPRGSSGRGEEFSKVIYADWGNKDGQDVRAAVDFLIAQGVADPARLGVGGWSYGGILTNYVIAQDQRFKAAVSGAGMSNILAGYGTDQYIREYENELGPPWKATDTYLRLSSPFLHADRITTATLFMCGESDFNVPLLNSEQMYQALRSLGRDTRLIIYPGEFHGIRTPSYLKDRLQRILDWYGTHLK